MSKQTINVGAAPDDGTGDPLRTAMQKSNANFDELYAADTTLTSGLAGKQNAINGTFTYAQLIASNPASSINLGFTAYATDVGPVYSDGARWVSAALNGPVDLRDFSQVDFTGNNDSASTVQIAINQATAAGRALDLTYGTIAIGTTLLGASNLEVFGRGRGTSGTILKPTMTDGSSLFDFSGACRDWGLRGFRISAPFNFTNYVNGSGNAANCWAIRAKKVSTNYPTRYHMSNLLISGCAGALDLDEGFTLNIDTVYLHFCELGLRGNVINAADINLRIEACRKGLEITNSYGVLFRQLLEQTANANTVASTVDGCRGVEFDTPYWEAQTHVRTQPYLKIGETTTCHGVEINRASTVAGSALAAGVYPIEADQVDGLEVSGVINVGTSGRTVKTTANTRNYRPRFIVRATGTLGEDTATQDGSAQVGPAFNYFPNRNFDMWFRGWDSFNVTRCVLSRETSIVRKGSNALRLTASAGLNFNTADFRSITGAAWVSSLRGRKVRVGTWVWIPDDAAYNETGRTASPDIGVTSFNGTTTVESTSSVRARRNAWNFITATVAIQTDATRITVLASQNRSSTNQAGTEFVVFDSISLVEETVPLQRQMDDLLVDSPWIEAVGVGGKCIMHGRTAAPTDADQVFEAGDQVWKEAPTANASPGWMCTTGGPGGTAVFKAMANLAA